MPYLVVDIIDDQEHSFPTLRQARLAARNLCPEGYSIWHGEIRRELYDPYCGDDDRVRQGLGIPTVSELPEGPMFEYICEHGAQQS